MDDNKLVKTTTSIPLKGRKKTGLPFGFVTIVGRFFCGYGLWIGKTNKSLLEAVQKVHHIFDLFASAAEQNCFYASFMIVLGNQEDFSGEPQLNWQRDTWMA